MNSSYIDHLESRGVKATAIRILVYRLLAEHHRAFSLRELDDELDTVDRSTIFRTLTLLLSHHLIHAIEDGTGITKYEACEGHDDCSLDDQHIHFFCTQCHRTFCMRTIQIPTIQLPEGFTMQSVNYMVKGTCSDCAPHVSP